MRESYCTDLKIKSIYSDKPNEIFIIKILKDLILNSASYYSDGSPKNLSALIDNQNKSPILEDINTIDLNLEDKNGVTEIKY